MGHAQPERGVAFAIDENNLEPVFLDFERDPFFLVFGESESGKSNMLRLLIKQLTERYEGNAAKFFVIDNRRALLDVTPATHLAEYVPMSNNMEHHTDALYDLMKRRTPSPDVTAQELRERSWWSGPTVYVVVDDYDLVSTSSGNPLGKLAEMLPFARDVGVRFIIARSTAGMRPRPVRALHAADAGARGPGPDALRRPHRGRHPRQRTTAPDAPGARGLRDPAPREPAGAVRAHGRRAVGRTAVRWRAVTAGGVRADVTARSGVRTVHRGGAMPEIRHFQALTRTD